MAKKISKSFIKSGKGAGGGGLVYVKWNINIHIIYIIKFLRIVA